ncbi:MAG: hypothetical protein KY475_12070 [Planctomycetes bacterium]|nr:hypothetical protein [Planctomycetota bacterium]
MQYRSLLVGLIYAYFTLLVAWGVMMGGYLLAVALQDSPLAQVLRIIGIACLVLLAINGVLLLLAVAMTVLAWEERARRRPPATPDPAQSPEEDPPE